MSLNTYLGNFELSQTIILLLILFQIICIKFFGWTKLYHTLFEDTLLKITF